MLLAVEGRGGGIRCFLGAHGDEGEAPRLAAHPIEHEIHLGNGAVLGEEILKIVFGDVVGEISHVEFCVH